MTKEMSDRELDALVAVVKAAQAVRGRFSTLPWSTTDAAPDAATCVPTMCWRDFNFCQMGDLDDALAALRACGVEI